MKRTTLSIRPGIRRFQALAAALLLSIATGSSPAADLPAGSAPAATDNAAIPEAPAATDNAAGLYIDPGLDVPIADNTWLDRSHTWVERGLFGIVVWFDRFFGDERIVIIERAEIVFAGTVLNPQEGGGSRP